MCGVKCPGTWHCWGKGYPTHLRLCIDSSSAALPLCFRWDSLEVDFEIQSGVQDVYLQSS